MISRSPYHGRTRNNSGLSWYDRLSHLQVFDFKQYKSSEALPTEPVEIKNSLIGARSNL